MHIVEKDVTISETGTHGKSLFATRDFKKDEVVFLAFGPVTPEPTPYTFPIGWDLFLDSETFEDNPVRYLCHSCEPNLGIKNRTELVAMQNIKAGEEVAIDYAMVVPFYGSVVSEENRTCKCGKPTCRGKMGAYDELTDQLKQKYEGYISDFLLTARPTGFTL